jgi:transposase
VSWSGSDWRDSSIVVEWSETAMTVQITRLELTPVELRREAARTKDADAARRMLAIALLLDGHSRELAARQSGMECQTLRDWVHRYNAEGLAGLFDRPHGGGTPRRLTAMQENEVADWVRAGPELEMDGVVRWRRHDLGRKIARVFGVHLHERSVGKLLPRLGFRHLSVRPRHPQAEPAAQEAHKKRMARPVRKRFLQPESEQSASTYPAYGHSPGQDGDPRASVLINFTASSAFF